MLQSLWGRNGRRGLDLQSRFMLYFGVIVVSLMTMVVMLVEQRLSSTMLHQTQMRGAAIAKSIAAVVTNALLSYDYVSLQQAAETATGDEGVLYVIILNKENVVAAYSGRPERQGRTLADPVSVAARDARTSYIQHVQSNPDEAIYSPYLDIAMPVRVEGTPVQWGTVRIGLSLDLLSAILAETRLALCLLGGGAVLIVLISARFLSRRITQPLEGLAQATARVATGDLDHTVDENLLGELGDLARSFNHMTNDLKRSRDAIRYQNQHLEHMVQLRTAALEEKAHELEAANAELMELDRLKSDFLSNVSHELRTPLTSIRSFTEIMLDEAQAISEGERREFLEIVANQAGRLTRLISDLLDLSKIEAGEFHCQLVDVRLQDTAEYVHETLHGLAASKGITLRNEVPAHLPAIHADLDRMSQVLTNLVDNALKFTPAGGRVTISARTSPRRRQTIGVTGQAEPPSGAFAGMESGGPETGEFVVVSVRDTGVGIHAEDQQRVFEKFGQVGNVLTDKPQGTGLGLAISGGIVVQHGGALWVESEPGVGSVFSFSIPVAQHASGVPAGGHGNGRGHVVAQEGVRTDPEAQAELVQVLKRTASGKQILVVDDEPSIVAVLTELLQPMGYRTVGCQSGSQAVAKARELEPDAIILDIMMPEINGYDVLRLLKSDTATARIPVIVLSVLDDKQKAFELGAAEYIRKPFEKQELLENVRALA